jgi:hypothetical protein
MQGTGTRVNVADCACEPQARVLLIKRAAAAAAVAAARGVRRNVAAQQLQASRHASHQPSFNKQSRCAIIDSAQGRTPMSWCDSMSASARTASTIASHACWHWTTVSMRAQACVRAWSGQHTRTLARAMGVFSSTHRLPTKTSALAHASSRAVFGRDEPTEPRCHSGASNVGAHAELCAPKPACAQV